MTQLYRCMLYIYTYIYRSLDYMLINDASTTSILNFSLTLREKFVWEIVCQQHALLHKCFYKRTNSCLVFQLSIKRVTKRIRRSEKRKLEQNGEKEMFSSRVAKLFLCRFSCRSHHSNRPGDLQQTLQPDLSLFHSFSLCLSFCCCCWCFPC